MRQHIFCFTVFIIIFGLMSIATVDAVMITEYFDSDPGWTSFNLPVDNNDFGFRNSNFAGGNTGEAGGFFSRTDQAAWYGNDTIGNFTGNEILSASGLMNIYNVEPDYNANIHIGHFDSSNPAPIGNGIGFQILEESASSFRIFYKIADFEGLLFIITGINESRNWSYLYDPSDSSYGSLTVSISGSGGNTAKVFLSEDQRNSIGTLNTFGLAVGREPSSPTPEQLELYIDNVSYTAVADVYTIGGYLQYRTFSDSSNLYRGWLEFTKNNNPIDASDITQIELKDSTGNPVTISGTAFYPDSYFWGAWNDSTSSVDFSGLNYSYGFSISFPGTTNFSAGNYTYEATTRQGDILTLTRNFPGETVLPVVDVASMEYEWLIDGGLHLTWSVPASGTYDQLRVTLGDQDSNGLFWVRLPPDKEELTIPAEWIQQANDFRNPSYAIWQVQTRSYASDGGNYARGYSGKVNIPWGDTEDFPWIIFYPAIIKKSNP